MTKIDDELTEEMDRADELLDELFERLVNEDADPIGVAYSMWVHLTHILTAAGWTPEELIRDAGWHATNESTEGGMQ